ncbi:hypothetical protein U9M48_016386, partial [Paspalum notatum var. saurae]
MAEVLVDRSVLYVDEVSEVMAELGAPPPPTVESIRQDLAALGLSAEEVEKALGRAMTAALSRYRKASRPSSVETAGHRQRTTRCLVPIEPCGLPPQVAVAEPPPSHLPRASGVLVARLCLAPLRRPPASSPAPTTTSSPSTSANTGTLKTLREEHLEETRGYRVLKDHLAMPAHILRSYSQTGPGLAMLLDDSDEEDDSNVHPEKYGLRCKLLSARIEYQTQ